MLDLGFNSIRDDGMRPMEPAIAKLRHFQVLVLAGGRLEAGVTALWPHLAQLTSLTELDPSHNNRPFRALWPHFANLYSLEVLRFAGNKVNDQAAAALAPHLASLTSLPVLDFGGPRDMIRDGGARALATQLSDAPRQQALTLNPTHVSNDLVQELLKIYPPFNSNP
ncbi:MAG: hypothetical protein HC767_02490 [Akkermansiaceae bacterium]|nr:hypothetical protein [Akkermansiaceae bacterium]